ncbi:MAG: hypothetical protein KAT46_00540 [Deltaproteobacteria bacterium]|nr:hypothetical protein [Deltaproteobacteria bacterium]
MKKNYLFFTIKPIMILLAFGLVFSSCSKKPETEEDALRAVVEEMAQKASEKNIRGVMNFISKDYRDDFGNERRTIKGILLFELIKKERAKVFLRKINVELDGDRAVVTVKAILARGVGVEKLSDIVLRDSAGFGFNLFFKKESDGKWRVVSGKWESIGASVLL